MHIECPNCQAVYDVPDDRLRAPGHLRCHLCEYSWILKEPAATALHESADKQTTSSAPQTENELAPAAETLQPHRSEQLAKSTNQSTRSNLNTLLIGATFILVVLAATLLGRQEILKIWPSSSVFFKALGIY